MLDLNSWSHRKSADQNSNPPLSFCFVCWLLGPHAHSVPLPPPHLSRQGSAPCYHTFIIPYLEWCLGSRVRTPLRCLVGGKVPVGHPNRGHHRAHNILFDTFALMPASHLLIAAPACAPSCCSTDEYIVLTCRAPAPPGLAQGRARPPCSGPCFVWQRRLIWGFVWFCDSLLPRSPRSCPPVPLSRTSFR